MKLDNKGITLIEIIISIALISIVIIFLFNLLIQVNNENSDSEVRTEYLINQSTFIKQIEQDFLEYGLDKVDDWCNYVAADYPGFIDLSVSDVCNDNINSGCYDYNVVCIPFIYYDSSYGHLVLYKKQDLSRPVGYKTMLMYSHGDYKIAEELKDFDWNLNYKYFGNTYGYIVPIISSKNNFYTYTLPIIGPDNKDYSIELSYYKG